MSEKTSFQTAEPETSHGIHIYFSIEVSSVNCTIQSQKYVLLSTEPKLTENRILQLTGDLQESSMVTDHLRVDHKSRHIIKAIAQKPLKHCHNVLLFHPRDS